MPLAQATFCKKCSYRVALNRPDRDAALHRGPRIQTLTPSHPPRTRCASNSSRTSAPARLAVATLRPFLPAPRRKSRLRVRSRMHSHDAAHRSTQVAPPLLRPPPPRPTPASSGARRQRSRIHRRPISFAAKIFGHLYFVDPYSTFGAFAFRHTPIQAIPTHLQTDRAKLI